MRAGPGEAPDPLTREALASALTDDAERVLGELGATGGVHDIDEHAELEVLVADEDRATFPGLADVLAEGNLTFKLVGA